MKALVFETDLGFVLIAPEPGPDVLVSLNNARHVGSLDTSALGSLTATMLESALEERGLFEIGPHAARLLFKAAGGLANEPVRTSA